MTKLIIERGSKGQMATSLPSCDVPVKPLGNLIPDTYQRSWESIRLPEVAEPELIRHYTNLSTKNHHVDKDFYPLGSCTMKYNPKINEWTAGQPIFAESHPLQPEALSQSQLQIHYELEQFLCGITGMKRFTLQPAAGSQGELTGVLIMRKYHEKRGNQKTKVLIPDAAHGTNPASVAMAGYEVCEIKSNARGLVDIEDLKSKLTPDVAGLMLTNPNTLGLFEENISQIVELIHSVDGLVYMDGANMNALIGIVRPADMGFDITHINLHKTFSTPHGGGGPGSGPIGVVDRLVPYLPKPTVDKNGETYSLKFDLPDSIGRLHGFYGNYGILVRAWTYIRMLGKDNLTDISKAAVINANYLMHRLKAYYHLPYDLPCMHEFVLSAVTQKAAGVKALDIAKRLLDYGFHAPTMYFPLIVKEALMIEPTESETRETLDRFVEVMIKIDEEIKQNPEMVHAAPHTTPVGRVDETLANRQLTVHW